MLRWLVLKNCFMLKTRCGFCTLANWFSQGSPAFKCSNQAGMDGNTTTLRFIFLRSMYGISNICFSPHRLCWYPKLSNKNIRALACHKSQNIIGPDGKYTKDMYGCGHPAMEDFIGKELGVHSAEAFIKMTGRKNGNLVIGVCEIEYQMLLK